MGPAAAAQSFPLLLAALFVVGLGFALQQIVANPYVIALGDPATGAHRATFAQGVNSFGTTIGPLVLSYLIFGAAGAAGAGSTAVSLDTLRLPYFVLAGAFVLFAGLLAVSKLPPITLDAPTERSLGALRYPQLLLGMVAIFVYVGTEVTIQSNLPELMRQPEILGLPAERTAHFISLYWGGLMVGRWAGAVAAFDLRPAVRRAATVVVPFVAYAVVLAVNAVKGSPMGDLLVYAPAVALLVGAFLVAQERPARTMTLFGAAGALLMAVGLVADGRLALYAFVAGGLFCSVMWPCIFALSIAGLGRYTNQGSSLLIMMILGGALLPPLQGLVADGTGIHASYVVPLAGFLYLGLYGVLVRRALRRQGLDYDDPDRLAEAEGALDYSPH
jgi:FHS family L-fucose permease-like MFS transporter